MQSDSTGATRRVLLANLKHFYQHRGLWLVYPLLAVVFAPAKGTELLGAFVVFSFLLGLLTGVTLMETLSKPFSFCLPGHRVSTRGLVFLLGLVVGLGGLSFWFAFVAPLASPSFTGPVELGMMPPGGRLLVAGAHFCASMTAYLLGAGLAAISGAAVLLITIPALLNSDWFGVFPAIQYPIVHCPVAMIALTLLVGATGWWWLGQPAWYRPSCTRPWIGLFDGWNRARGPRHGDIYADRFAHGASPRLDRLFHRVVARCGTCGLGRYAWGAWYATGSLIIPQWKVIFMCALGGVAFGGYFRPGTFFLAMFSFLTTRYFQWPIPSLPLIPGGRKEKFIATIALTLGLSAVWVLLLAVFIGLIHLLAPLVPAVMVRGVTLTLQAPSFSALSIPLAMVPLGALVETLFHRRLVEFFFSVTLVTVIMILQPAITPALAILSWGICLSLLYWIAMHGDLARR